MSTKDNSKKENATEGGYITTSARISKRERKIKGLEFNNAGVNYSKIDLKVNGATIRRLAKE